MNGDEKSNFRVFNFEFQQWPISCLFPLILMGHQIWFGNQLINGPPPAMAHRCHLNQLERNAPVNYKLISWLPTRLACYKKLTLEWISAHWLNGRRPTSFLCDAIIELICIFTVFTASLFQLQRRFVTIWTIIPPSLKIFQMGRATNEFIFFTV